MGQWANDHELAVVAQKFRRHAFEFAAKKHVEEEGLQHVIAVMTQCQFVALQLACHFVQNTAAQTTAQTAHGFAFGNFVLDDGVGVLRFNVKRNAHVFQIGGQDFCGKAGLLLVQVDGNEFKVNGRTRFHFEQNVEHAVAVFAARHADHDAVAFFNHVEFADGLTHLAAQAFF